MPDLQTSKNEAADTNTHGRAFPPEEYASRVAAVRARMDLLGADLLLVDAVESMAYLFGYVPPAAFYQAVLLPLAGEPVAIVRGLDVPTFEEQSWVSDHIVVRDWEDPVQALVDTIGARGWSQSRIAIELDSAFLTAGRFLRIRDLLSDAVIVDFSGVLWELRLIKSDLEVAYLRRAGEIADRALQAAADSAGVGVPERACAAALYSAALLAGADNGRNALMAAGPRSNSLHGRLGSRILERGDILHVESVPLYFGYGARVMRPVVIGKASAEQESVATRLIDCQDRQFDMMRPGAAASDVDRVLRDGVLLEGLRTSYDNITGYTLGYIGLPRTSDFTRVFHPHVDWELRSGMAFHMYTSAAGLAFSETILITDDGHERLTLSPRTLLER